MKWLDNVTALLRLLRLQAKPDPAPRCAKPRQLGDIVLPHEVIRLYSENPTEDGLVLRLFDLIDGRTGAQIDDGPIWYAD